MGVGGGEKGGGGGGGVSEGVLSPDAVEEEKKHFKMIVDSFLYYKYDTGGGGINWSIILVFLPKALCDEKS